MVFKKVGFKPKTSQLNPQEQYWSQVDLQARELITTTFKHLIVEEAYSDYLEEYKKSEIPENPQTVAEQLAYEYLLGLTQNVLEGLSKFSCHDSQYFEQLIQNE